MGMRNDGIEMSIVLLSWNRKRFLEKGLKSMMEALSPDVRHEIILMDNASEDGTQEVLKSFASHPEVKVVLNKRNLRFKGFNKLFGLAKGRIIVEVDDDVIEFPKGFDRIFIDYFKAFPDYGYLALDTVVNELTDGNRGAYSFVDRRGDMVVEEGESRGYCAAFLRKDYRLIRPLTFLFRFSLRHPQDWVISGLVRRVLRKRNGVIRGVKCLHAYGPLYAREFGRLKYDWEKLETWRSVGLKSEYEKKLKGFTPHTVT